MPADESSSDSGLTAGEITLIVLLPLAAIVFGVLVFYKYFASENKRASNLNENLL